MSRIQKVAKSERKRKLTQAMIIRLQQNAAVANLARELLPVTQFSNVLGEVKNASFIFFCQKVDALYRSGDLKYLVGVDMSVFHKLLNIVRHEDKAKYSPIVRLTLFLKFAKEGKSQNVLSREVGLSQPTISRLIRGVIYDLVEVAGDYIKFPTTREELFAMEKGFMEKEDRHGNLRQMPCFAVLDGKHWACDHPRHSGSTNYNYKSFFSFNSLFVCDAEYRICYIQISTLGINSDSQLFNCGPLSKLIENISAVGGIRKLPGSNIVMPPLILADNGFALSKTVMQPYRSFQLSTSRCIEFNRKISGTRVQIEDLFGVLRSKFQIFATNLRLDPENSRSLIVALSVVHNISVGPLITEPIPDSPVIIDPYTSAEQQRTAFKNYILSRNI